MVDSALKYPLKYVYNNFITLKDETDFIYDVLALFDIVGGEKFVYGEVLWDSRIGTVIDIFRHENLENIDKVELKTFLQYALNNTFKDLNITNFNAVNSSENKMLTLNMTIEKKQLNKIIKKDISYEWSY